MCDVVDTLETGLNHATEQLPFSDYGYEAINQPLYRDERSESKTRPTPVAVSPQGYYQQIY